MFPVQEYLDGLEQAGASHISGGRTGGGELMGNLGAVAYEVERLQ